MAKKDKIITLGSCFAQHIGRALSKWGFNWVDGEPAPGIIPVKEREDYQYSIFSFRTGNIYNPVILKQWLQWSIDKVDPSKIEVWEKNGRYIDPFRPNIEPNGFASVEDLYQARKATFNSILKNFSDSDIFIFTLGLTETWINTDTEICYAACPGTIGGKFDEKVHSFKKLSFSETLSAMKKSIDLVKSLNPRVKTILTVSPVPLTATATSSHVLPATIESKSVLRAVAGQLSDSSRKIDYFPSYELIFSPSACGFFFESNKRSVNGKAVDFVMSVFKSSLESAFGKFDSINSFDKSEDSKFNEICEESLLEQFSNR